MISVPLGILFFAHVLFVYYFLECLKPLFYPFNSLNVSPVLFVTFYD